MPGGKGKPGGGVGATFSPSSAASLLLSPEYDAYQTGLRFYSSRKFKQAIKAFEDMLKQFPNGKYADNAYYWLGECYYSLKEFSLALGFYEKVFLKEGSLKADDAQFKIGMTRLSMGKQNDAKMDLKKLVDRYPSSEYRERAVRMLKQLK
jgi:tol-pal system protein YbgF